MLPKKERLNKKEFSHIAQKSIRIRAPHISASFRFIPADTTKASFVVSKKIAKTATSRNTLRRRGYHVLKTFPAHTLQGLGIIFFFNAGSEKLPYTAVREEIAILLSQIKR